MFVNIESFFFHPFRNAETVYDVESFEDEEAHTCRPCTYHEGTEYLCTQETCTCTVEETFAGGEKPREYGSEETADTMYGGGTYRVVNLKYLVDEFHREDHYDAADGTDDDCTQWGTRITPCRDAYQTCQDTVQGE